MPKSDTWPGGTGLERMTGMDSAGSCDSVVSVNSGFSDDSLDHLSAEEKACLMFLEETIESLDTEEDSGMSNDEPDQLPAHGNLATRMANLSASMENSKLNSPSKHHYNESPMETSKTSKHPNPKHSYMVPTPFAVANSSQCFQPKPKPSLPPDKKNLHTKPQAATSHDKPDPQHGRQHNAPCVPTEVNVVVIPPPTKPKEHAGRTPEGPSPRGPLSYEALVHLRRSASEKKSPLCPTLDHTIELDKPPVIRVARYPNHGDLRRAPSGAAQESHRPKTRPPAVAPKPKSIPAHVVVMTQTETAVANPDSSHNGGHDPDAQRVRLEALQKLGLPQDGESQNEDITPRSPSKTPSWDLNSYRFIRDPIYSNPSRSPSFSYSQTPTGPRARPVQSSASFHHYSRVEPRSVSPSRPIRPSGGRLPTRERSGAGNQIPSHPHPQLHSAAVGSQQSSELQYCPKRAPELAKTAMVPQTVPHKPSTPQGYSVKMVSGMGADRKEALRKLGLLKE